MPLPAEPPQNHLWTEVIISAAKPLPFAKPLLHILKYIKFCTAPPWCWFPFQYSWAQLFVPTPPSRWNASLSKEPGCLLASQSIHSCRWDTFIKWRIRHETLSNAYFQFVLKCAFHFCWWLLSTQYVDDSTCILRHRSGQTQAYCFLSPPWISLA